MNRYFSAYLSLSYHSHFANARTMEATVDKQVKCGVSQFRALSPQDVPVLHQGISFPGAGTKYAGYPG
jgi:hypothetical protein